MALFQHLNNCRRHTVWHSSVVRHVCLHTTSFVKSCDHRHICLHTTLFVYISEAKVTLGGTLSAEIGSSAIFVYTLLHLFTYRRLKLG